MDRSTSCIPPDEIDANLGTAAASLIFICGSAAFAGAPAMIASASYRPPDEIERSRTTRRVRSARARRTRDHRCKPFGRGDRRGSTTESAGGDHDRAFIPSKETVLCASC
jgi:hypothetical protein